MRESAKRRKEDKDFRAIQKKELGKMLKAKGITTRSQLDKAAEEAGIDIEQFAASVSPKLTEESKGNGNKESASNDNVSASNDNVSADRERRGEKENAV